MKELPPLPVVGSDELARLTAQAAKKAAQNLVNLLSHPNVNVYQVSDAMDGLTFLVEALERRLSDLTPPHVLGLHAEARYGSPAGGES